MNWKRIPGIYWMHQQFWNAHSSTWDEATNTDEYRHGLGRLTSAVGERSSTREGKVLDLGCGTGNYSIALAKDGWHLESVDLSPKMLARASAKAEAACPGHVHFQRANFNRRLPFEDQAFRHVLCIAALQCVGEPAFFAEIHRVVEAGGHFYGVFRDNEMRDKRKTEADAPKAKRTRRWTTMMHLKARVARTKMITHWTEESMRRTLLEAGFTIEECEPFYRGTKLVIAQRPA